jgi:hypothetical protein
VLRAYFDESGTQSRDRIITVAGIVATERRWRRLSVAWNDTLHRFGVVGEFKAAHCTRGTHQYESWPLPKCTALRVALARLINGHGLYAVGISISHDEFVDEVKRFSSPGTPAHDPYVWCMRTCLEVMAGEPTRKSRRIACVFDEGFGGQRVAFEHFKNVRRLQWESWGRVFYGSLNAAPSDEYPPLQAADLMVYELRHHTDSYVKGTPKDAASLAAVFAEPPRMPITSGHMSRRHLAGVRRELEARQHYINWCAWEEYAVALA